MSKGGRRKRMNEREREREREREKERDQMSVRCKELVEMLLS